VYIRVWAEEFSVCKISKGSQLLTVALDAVNSSFCFNHDCLLALDSPRASCAPSMSSSLRWLTPVFSSTINARPRPSLLLLLLLLRWWREREGRGEGEGSQVREQLEARC